MIGDNIIVSVVEIRADKVRLGITAPDDVTIDREEIRAAKAINGQTRNPARGKLYRTELVAASKEAEDLLAKVAFGEYIDPAVIQRVIDRLQKASGEINAMDWENKRNDRMKGRK